MLPTLEVMFELENRFETHRRLFAVSLAILEYRIDHKVYPRSLDELAPKYIDRVPVDAYANRSIVYRRADGGFLLYSFGTDGEDDNGVTVYDDEDADDVTIRVPAE